MPLVRRTPADRPDPAALRRLAQLAALAPTAPGAPGAPTLPTEEAWWADHTRVAAPPPAPAPAPAPPELLLPGRHAARGRSRPALPGLLRLPGLPGLPALPGLGVAHLAVVALTVALGLALTTWWIVRDQGQPLDPAAAPLTPVAAAASEPLVALPSAGADPAPAPGATTGAPTGTVTVDVTGKVRRPGIVVLDQGARVTDALAAAGGARKGVDLSPLNLARVLVDGEQVVVGTAARAGAGAVPAPATGPGSGSGSPGQGATPLVNLNTAGQTELEGLPQVGPVTAQAILAWRTEHGGFTRVGELLEVDGIGPKTLDQLLPHVTV